MSRGRTLVIDVARKLYSNVGYSRRDVGIIVAIVIVMRNRPSSYEIAEAGKAARLRG